MDYGDRKETGKVNKESRREGRYKICPLYEILDMRLKQYMAISLRAFRVTVTTSLKPISQLLRFDYDTTTTRRYHDAFDYDGSDRNYDSAAIRLRSDYDVSPASASIRRDSTRAKK